jgi:hypothetical protein
MNYYYIVPRLPLLKFDCVKYNCGGYEGKKPSKNIFIPEKSISQKLQM